MDGQACTVRMPYTTPSALNVEMKYNNTSVPLPPALQGGIHTQETFYRQLMDINRGRPPIQPTIDNALEYMMSTQLLSRTDMISMQVCATYSVRQLLHTHYQSIEADMDKLRDDDMKPCLDKVLPGRQIKHYVAKKMRIAYKALSEIESIRKQCSIGCVDID